MNLNLRKAILENITDNDQEQLHETVVDAVQKGEEKTLPGLGVLFELIWNQSSASEQTHMVKTLEAGVKESAQ